MLDIIVINLLFLILPIICYLIYIVYENIIGKKGNILFLDFAIISSLYLIVKYSNYFEYGLSSLKILLFLSLLINRKFISVILSLYICFCFSTYYDINLYYYLIEYISLLIIYYLFDKLSYKIKFVFIFIILIIIESYVLNFKFIYVIIINFCYMLLSIILFKLLNKLEQIINIYGNVRSMEEDKNLRDSLFKVTHEIKNPIAVCKGYLDMLDTDNNKQVNKYIPIIKQEINRTLTLMNDFLCLTKIKVEKDTIDIVVLVDDISSSIDTLLIGKNIHFIFDTIDDEIYIEGDYDRLKQVLINLIKNSIESIKKDDIGLIKLKINYTFKKVCIILEDNGIGMNKETLKRIGEPFYTTKKNGTGLGVKLSKEIVELHNGKIIYESKLGKGTMVKIFLPIKKHA